MKAMSNYTEVLAGNIEIPHGSKFYTRRDGNIPKQWSHAIKNAIVFPSVNESHGTYCYVIIDNNSERMVVIDGKDIYRDYWGIHDGNIWDEYTCSASSPELNEILYGSDAFRENLTIMFIGSGSKAAMKFLEMDRIDEAMNRGNTWNQTRPYYNNKRKDNSVGTEYLLDIKSVIFETRESHLNAYEEYYDGIVSGLIPNDQSYDPPPVPNGFRIKYLNRDELESIESIQTREFSYDQAHLTDIMDRIKDNGNSAAKCDLPVVFIDWEHSKSNRASTDGNHSIKSVLRIPKCPGMWVLEVDKHIHKNMPMADAETLGGLLNPEAKRSKKSHGPAGWAKRTYLKIIREHNLNENKLTEEIVEEYFNKKSNPEWAKMLEEHCHMKNKAVRTTFGLAAKKALSRIAERDYNHVQQTYTLHDDIVKNIQKKFDPNNTITFWTSSGMIKVGEMQLKIIEANTEVVNGIRSFNANKKDHFVIMLHHGKDILFYKDWHDEPSNGFDCGKDLNCDILTNLILDNKNLGIKKITIIELPHDKAVYEAARKNGEEQICYSTSFDLNGFIEDAEPWAC